MQKVIDQNFVVNYSFPIIFTKDVFDTKNTTLSDVIAKSNSLQNRIITIIEKEIVQFNPNILEDINRYGELYREVIQFVDSPFLIQGGEICKKDCSVVEKILYLVNKHKLCRHSFIIAIGGGALLDAVGYAAATAHRGIRLIRMPTSVLAQNDAGVGVKNGVNAFGRKNFIGTFSPPFAVINDSTFIQTLSFRDQRAGIAEAVKVALIRDQEFFDFLYQERKNLFDLIPSVMDKMIFRCAELHSQHISCSGDPFEMGSSRPLDFGHWIAHKLEELTDGDIRHGEAVAIGIAVDSLYSFRIGLLSEFEINKILSLLNELGLCFCHPALSLINPKIALEEFREHLGGKLTIPLLDGIGRKIEINDIDIAILNECIHLLTEGLVNQEMRLSCTV